MTTDIASYAINTIRTLSIDAVQKANSGHPGAPMGLAAVAYTVWHKHMRHNPSNPNWPNRDRFVLSNGHASMLLYSMLHLTGYEDMTLDQIKDFRQWGSLTPGHPEAELTPGVEVTTGPLGQGFATSVGLAMAEAQLNARFDGAIDHYTFGICSDGDLMEGISHEAASLAGHLGLGKLIFLYDDNNITIDGTTAISFTEDVQARFEAYGWHTDMVTDGNDVDALDQAISAAKKVTDKPSLISVKTVIGFGSPSKAGTSSSHGSPLGDEEILKTKAQLGWPHTESFVVPDEVVQHMDARAKGQAHEIAWQATMKTLKIAKPDAHAELTRRLSGELPKDWQDGLPHFEPDAKGMATRASSGKVIDKVYGLLPELTGGSADLAGSNKTLFTAHGLLARHDFNGQNVHFGVREHAMAAAANGMCLHGGLRGFGATFMVFSDYMRPSLRLAALMHVPSIMVFTHDSIGLGEDGPTHQPIEHVMSLRAMPNYWVMRPADANEVTACWAMAMERKDGPCGLVLTRQNVPTYDHKALGTQGDASKGGYILASAKDGATPEVILIATGSEVSICMDAWKTLNDQNIPTRVVSIPCWEAFDAQGKDWVNKVLPPNVQARVSIEAGVTLGWQKYVGAHGTAIGLDHFGASAPFETLYEKFGLTAKHVVDAAQKLR